MTVNSIAKFLEDLQQSNLLGSDDLQSAKSAAEEAIDTAGFARELTARGLLTAWQAQMLLSGRKGFFLGKYKLLQELGRGGMGAVFQAEQQPLGRVVALKVMAPKLVKDADAVARFHREIRVAAQLEHPNIVRAFDADRVGNTHFLVMEFVDGKDLSSVIDEHGQLPIATACEYVLQAARGLQHAHEKGMAHRDIKPANLLLSQRPDGAPIVKILDMGLSRFTSELGQDGGITQTGQIMGTPDYIAPEQARDTKSADIRSDIFSLGCTLYRLLTGELPYSGANVVEKLMARATGEAQLLRSVRTDAPVELESVVARMLAREPQDRYATPSELIAGLAPFTSTETASAETASSDAAVERITVGDDNEPEPAEQIELGLPAPSAGNETLGVFLNRLATAAADENQATETAFSGEETQQSPRAADATHGSYELTPLQQAIAKRKVADRRKLLAAGAIAVVCVLLLGAMAVWKSRGKTTLTVDWPVTDRSGGSVEIDGRSLSIDSSSLVFVDDPGVRQVRLTRPGYEPIEARIGLGRGESQVFVPEWIPTADTRRQRLWSTLRRETIDAIGKLAAEPAQTDPSEFDALKETLFAFREQHRGTPEAMQVAQVLSGLQWPIDRIEQLNRDGQNPGPVFSVESSSDRVTPVCQLGDPRLKHGKQITALAFRQQLLVSVGSDSGTLAFWNLEDGSAEKVQPAGWSRAVFPRNSEAVIVLDGKSPITVIDLATGETQAEINSIPSSPMAVAVTHDGLSLLTVSSAGLVSTFDLQTEQQLGSLQLPVDSVPSFAVLSDDGRLVAFPTAQEHAIEIWNTTTGKRLHRLLGHDEPVQSLCFSADSQLLASTGDTGERTIRVWETETGNLRKTLKAGRYHMQFSPDTKLLAAVDYTSIDIFDVESGERKFSVPTDFGATPIAFSADGKLFAAVVRTGVIQVWDVDRGMEAIPTGDEILSAAFSPDGQWLACGTGRGRIRLWSLKNLQETEPLVFHDMGVNTLAFSEDSELIAGGGMTSVQVWRIQQRMKMNGFKTQGFVLTVDFQPDSHVLAAGDFYGTVTAWDAASQSLVWKEPGPEGRREIFSVDFSPDGQQIGTAAWDWDECLQVREAATGRQLRVLRGHDSNVRVVEFHPHGELMLSGSMDGMVCVWSTVNRVRQDVMYCDASVNDLSISPDGVHLIVATALSELQHWTFPLKSRDRSTLITNRMFFRTAFSPDSRHFVAVDRNGLATVYRFRSWNEAADQLN